MANSRFKLLTAAAIGGTVVTILDDATGKALHLFHRTINRDPSWEVMSGGPAVEWVDEALLWLVDGDEDAMLDLLQKVEQVVQGASRAELRCAV